MKVDVMKIRQMSPESFALYLRENDFKITVNKKILQ